uniref:WD_REPEATS_REGION domain-containing protein n=1 Tax=Gongylonema pulchrum TaxID=637853 RepID=A0A183DFK4_9BILA
LLSLKGQSVNHSHALFAVSENENLRLLKKHEISFRRPGRVLPYVPRTLQDEGATRLLTRTYTLDGHSRTVLSVNANGAVVISGSKDRTAKVWDLEKSVEKCTFGLHPNNVSCVRFIPASQMALTVSLATVRIWDLRSEECVRTLNSSGLAAAGKQRMLCTKIVS